MSKENIMIIIFLSIIYGISTVISFVIALSTKAVYNIKNRLLKSIISVLLGLMSPITITLFVVLYLLSILMEKVFILNDIYGVIRVVCFGLRAKDLPNDLERDELIQILDEILEKRKSRSKIRLNDNYAKKIWYKYWGIK